VDYFLFSFSTGNTYQIAFAWFFLFRGQNVHLGGENFSNSQKPSKNSHVPCPNSAPSHLPRSSQPPNPIKIFCVFPNLALYFGHILDPENTLPDPVLNTGPLGRIGQSGVKLTLGYSENWIQIWKLGKQIQLNSFWLLIDN